LKELRESFETLEFTEAVALLREKEKDSWFLSVKWVAGKQEKECLRMIISKYCAETFESNGYTMFHDFREKS